MIIRTIECDSCHAKLDEPTQNSGFKGWGHIAGISLNGVDQPNLCPECLAKVAEFIDGGLNNGVD